VVQLFLCWLFFQLPSASPSPLSPACSCLVPAGVKQATLKGSDWRYVVAYWPTTVGDLFGPRGPDNGDAPCALVGRQSAYGALLKTRVKEKPASSTKRARKTAKAAGQKQSRFQVNESGFCGSDDDFDSVSLCDNTDSEREDGEDGPVVSPRVESTAFLELFDGKPMHEAVQELVCRAAQLTGKLCGDNMHPDTVMTDGAANELADEAYDFVTRYVAVILGTINTPKAHRLAYHLLLELTLRGNVTEADTSVNEVLHKWCKAMYTRTNKNIKTYTHQLMRCEQTLSFILTEDKADEILATAATDGGATERSTAGASVGGHQQAATNNKGPLTAEERADVGSKPEDDYPALDPTLSGPDCSDEEDGSVDDTVPAGSETRRPRVRGQRVRVDEAAAGDGGRLQRLPALLGLTGGQSLTVRSSLSITATFEWGAANEKQWVYATPSNRDKPWYSFIRYKVPSTTASSASSTDSVDMSSSSNSSTLPSSSSAVGTEPVPPPIFGSSPPTPSANTCWGLARLIVYGVDGEPSNAVIVQRLVPAAHSNGCVRTAFGAKRLQWDMDMATGQPSLAAVPFSAVQRLEQIEPDFIPLAARHGMFATHRNTPNTSEELGLHRFFINNFHPWTSSKQTPM